MLLTCRSFFGSFEGFSDCNIRALDLYHKPKTDNKGFYARDTFCATRKALLGSLSDGGRIGFDSPYIPHGEYQSSNQDSTTDTYIDCYYRWYTVQEICMLLDRFDGVVFVGDDSLQTVYNGLNVLLRQDLALGAVKAWEMDQNTRDACRCDRQFNSASCAEHFVKSDQDVKDNTPSIGSPYYCARTPHCMVSVNKLETVDQIQKAIPQAPRSNYRPIPIIHSSSPGNTDIDSASKLLLTTLKIADDSKRKTPMLWLGPTAAGHLDIKGRKGNQEIWDFDRHMAKVATDNDIEVLNMWNLTVQASSYDGLRFGEKVAITQAMMVVNWLARLESS